ncbi:hypothetical protein LBMAG53_31380 [Planctomycetota bacterium]|nr:hypothetical protein LBMAG53_31380 [Planctomycetota bacterium]
MYLPHVSHLILFTTLIGSVIGADINHAPVVNAGPDLTITLPDTASLNGLVVDDDLPIGAALTFAWTVVSGPATVSFGSPDSVSTSAAFSKAGAYVLELRSSDGDLTGVDQVLITVITAGTVNQPPVVSAGPDQTVVAPAVITLNGAVSDDGLPAGGPATHGWTLVSGPGTIDLTMPTSLNPVLTIGTPGVYVLRLDASDGSLTSSDQVTIAVTPGSTTNQAPVVAAGGDQAVTLPSGGTATATVSGSVTDDGLPVGSTVSTTWSLVVGPGSVSITSQGSLATTVTFTVVGTYELQLTASDTLLSASDRVLITVSTGSTGNGAPSVSAGSDQVISAPGSCTLIGLVSDDGLPGGSLSHLWSMQSGPGAVTIASPGSEITTVQFAQLGTYVMLLSASDGALTGSDQMVVTVGVDSGGGSSGSGSSDGGSNGGCGFGVGAALGALALSGLFLRQRRAL